MVRARQMGSNVWQQVREKCWRTDSANVRATGRERGAAPTCTPCDRLTSPVSTLSYWRRVDTAPAELERRMKRCLGDGGSACWPEVLPYVGLLASCWLMPPPAVLRPCFGLIEPERLRSCDDFVGIILGEVLIGDGQLGDGSDFPKPSGRTQGEVRPSMQLSCEGRGERRASAARRCDEWLVRPRPTNSSVPPPPDGSPKPSNI